MANNNNTGNHQNPKQAHINKQTHINKEPNLVNKEPALGRKGPNLVNKEPRLGRKIGADQDNSTPRDLRVYKPVWAAYSNMARQNIYQTLCHISHVIGLEADMNDPKLEENLLNIPAIRILNQKGRAEVKAKSIKMLESHFPFLGPMVEKMIQLNVNNQKKEAPGKKNFVEDKDKTPDIYYEVFVHILPLINLLRNYYSHNILIDDRISREGKIIDERLQARCHRLAIMLDYCMTGAIRTVKDRFTVGDNASFKEIDFAFFEGENRYFDYIKVNDEGFALLDDKGRMQKIKREKKSYIYKVGARGAKDRYTHLTNMGIYLLLCLFLNKKYAKEFGDKIDFWGASLKKNRPSENVMSIIHEISCVYRMRLPKERLQSEKGKSAVGLDMLNELKKCPKPLFETLSAKDQDKFRVEVKDSEEDTGSTVLMVRSFDRFPTLALQYLDLLHKLDRIRFQVDLGNYRYKFYEKKNWIDKADEESASRVRVLQKELKGYGRLDEIEQQRKERWEGLIRAIDRPSADSFDSKPYITDHHASYHIEGNHIGMQWNTGSGHDILDKSGVFMPSTDLHVVNDDKAKAAVAPLEAPKCYLSIYDLPAVCFLTYLTGSGNAAEELIINTTEKYFEFFKDLSTGKIMPYDKETKESFIPIDIKEMLKKARVEARKSGGQPQTQVPRYVIEPYGIDLASLPRKIQDYLLGDSSQSDGNARFRRLANEKLKEMLEFTGRKLDSIKEAKRMYASKDNKLGKKSHIDIRQGTLARFLAKDMVFFKKPDAEGRVVLTSQNFDILQKELALFNRPLSELKQLFIAAELIGCKSSEENHPFLQNVLNRNPSSFLDFYIAYLSERKKYLEDILMTKICDYSQYHFLHPESAKWDNRNAAFYKELASRYTTIDLPGNLFLDAIVEELKKIDTTTLEKPQVLADALAQERKNVTFLINAYMQAIGDGYQPFYGYKRCYKYFSMTYKPQWDFSNPIEKLSGKYLTVGQMEQFISDNDHEAREQFYIAALNDRKTEKIKRAKSKGRYNPYKEKILETELQESKAEASEKLRHSLKLYKENEKEIRRVKVQDAVLYMIAKEVLTHTLQNADLSAYKLKYIGKGSETDILSMQLPFAVKLQIKTKVDSTKEVTIRQADLKLKNYGDFFRFIYDSRIQPLLANVDAEVIDREQLEKELDNYDQQRVPLFEYVHNLESRVCDTLSEEQFYKDAEGNPVKVDFKYLMEYINANARTKDLLKSIRNAFCHSTYPEGSRVTLVFEKEEGKWTIPNVANAMADSFETRSKSATPKQKKVKK